MTRSDIIEELKQYFDIEELVCRHTFLKHNGTAWMFFRTELLETLLIVRRDILQIPIYVNNWKQGGNLDERGLRCNLCTLVKDKTKNGQQYLSAHVLGAGVDFSAGTIPAEQARGIIAHHEELLPYPIRLEQNVSWVHLDVYDCINGKQINYFTV